MNSPRFSAPAVGRFTGLVLILIVAVCVAMIGIAGYLKYRLDRAEASLAAPEATLAADQDAYQQLRRGLGFGGYTGLAQTFATSHDPTALPAMRQQLKEVQDQAARLPERTPAETRHDVQAILQIFAAAQTRAEKSVEPSATAATGAALLLPNTNASFSEADMTPLYAALPVLDARASSATVTNRVAAQGQLQFWGMLLTLASWVSLIIAAAMAAGIYLTLRDRNAVPLRALAQSVSNMARGDLRTAIWGLERTDLIGELARAVDRARYQFGQLPDLTMIGEDGPVRLRFEGGAKSLFEAMIQVISRDSEQVHQQAASLTAAIISQQEALNLIASRVEAVLQNTESRALGNDQQIRTALQNMVGSATSLQASQEHAADQLNRIVPYLQERAQGLAELTQLTGQQVSQVLRSLLATERGLKNSAEQSDQAIRKIASTADTLGERLFGAVNLLQASGKVLAETTDKTQTRLDQAIERIAHRAAPDFTPLPMPALKDSSEDAAPRMQAVIEALEGTHGRLKELLTGQAQATRAQIDLLTTHSNGLLTSATTASQTLSSAADHMRREQAGFDELLGSFALRLNELGGKLEQQATAAVAEAAKAEPRVIVAPAAIPAADPAPYAEMAVRIDQLSERLALLGSTMEALVKAETGGVRSTLAELPAQMQAQWYQMAGQIEATRSSLADIITGQITAIEQRLAQPAAAASAGGDNLAEAQAQMEQQTQILSELVATLGVLDAHMQEIRSEVAVMRQQAG